MDLIWNGIIEALRLIGSGDPEIYGVTALTLYVSGLATIISLFIGIPLGTLMALKRFSGRRFVISLINTGMGMPPVVVGLWVSIFLWRYGPLGFLHMLYTPSAIIVAQTVISTPVVTGFTIAAIQHINPRLHLQIMALGASKRQYLWSIMKEARLALIAAVIAGFGSVISEVGASMMVGGNIKGYTRVLTTATAMEVSKGSFSTAVALSVFLMLLTYGITLILTYIQQWEGKDRSVNFGSMEIAGKPVSKILEKRKRQ